MCKSEDWRSILTGTERGKKGRKPLMVKQNLCHHMFTMRHHNNGHTIEWCPKCGYIKTMVR